MKNATRRLLNGRRILVVEDEYFIADDLCRVLRNSGATVLGPVADVARGLELIRTEKTDAAVVDVNLGGEMSYVIASELDSRKVPFLFATGYDRWAIPSQWEQVPHIEKPFDPDLILEMLAGLIVPPMRLESRS